MIEKVGLLLVERGVSWLGNLKKERPLPKVELFGEDGIFHLYLDTDHNSIKWKIIRVEVLDSNIRECLAQYGFEQKDTVTKYRPGPWRDFCDYPEGAQPVEMIAIHPGCYKAILSFTCETPSRVWWKPRRLKRERVPYKYVPNTQPIDHPVITYLSQN